MTRFTGGPADGRGLFLKHGPRFLRVCTSKGPRGGPKIDALDAPTDMPAAGETMHVYRLVMREKLQGIVCVRGAKGGGSFSEVRYYQFHDVQPDQAVLQSSRDWADWCHNQPHHEITEVPCPTTS